MPAFALNQQLQRLTHGDVVINNEYANTKGVAGVIGDDSLTVKSAR
jgi:hypothetical protein